MQRFRGGLVFRVSFNSWLERDRDEEEPVGYCVAPVHPPFTPGRQFTPVSRQEKLSNQSTDARGSKPVGHGVGPVIVALPSSEGRHR